ncbi:MAG: hypothetical protein ACK5RL_20005 [Acidimicrobiales bacterium]
MASAPLLLGFAEAVVRDDGLDTARRKLVEAVGPAAAGQAAATVAAFCGLVRVADGTGIPVDEGLAEVSADLRRDLGIDGYRGAATTRPADGTGGPFVDVDALWRH